MTVRIEKDGSVWTIVHSRPEARNAMGPESAEALYQAFVDFDAEEFDLWPVALLQTLPTVDVIVSCIIINIHKFNVYRMGMSIRRSPSIIISHCFSQRCLSFDNWQLATCLEMLTFVV